MSNFFLLIPLTAGVLSLVFAIYKTVWISRQDKGSKKLQEIARAIRSGAMAFLRREYKALIGVVIVVFLALFLGKQGSMRLTAVSFLFGVIFSGLAGFIGMNAATMANYRTAHGAKKGLVRALQIAFNGGSVMGLSVVGLALIGVSGLTFFFTEVLGHTNFDHIMEMVEGFALGASAVALFARVGGGIFTKAADVGADLVGKVEAGIPEDDKRNPATIADNVGDNVGDVAGLGSDLCESYIATIIGAMILGSTIKGAEGQLVYLPVLLAGAGVVMSMVATFFVRTKEGGNPQTALNLGTIGSNVLMLAVSLPIIILVAPASFSQGGATYTWLGIFLAMIIGLACGVLIGIITEYYTSDERKPAREIARQSQTGPATNIIAGIQVGMLATGLPVLMLAVAIYFAYMVCGLYGISLAALGMLATTGIQLAVDAYGPIADNAGGLAEMSGMPHTVRERTDKLDAVGNTTAAIGKGFAIGSAALTSLALFVAFKEKAGLPAIDVTKTQVVVGLLVGAMLPYVFSSFVIGAVGRAAGEMINEVRRQFREIKGLLKGKQKPDYVRCVDIATIAALREMVIPSISAVMVPILVGFLFGPEMLGGLLVGVLASSIMLALFMANAGGAWDNAKKYIESGAFGGKGSEAHNAGVIGDTVGDPFKDTAGPAMDIVVKLMSIISIVIVGFDQVANGGLLTNLF